MQKTKLIRVAYIPYHDHVIYWIMNLQKLSKNRYTDYMVASKNNLSNGRIDKSWIWEKVIDDRKTCKSYTCVTWTFTF